MALTAPCTVTSSDSEPAEFIIPDFFSDCGYPMRLNPHCYPVSHASAQWLCDEAHLVEPEITKYTSVRAGYFAAALYPNANAFHLKVCADVLNWSFKLDDWLEIDRFDVNDAWRVRDCCMSALRDPINFQTERYSAKMCKSFFSRFKETGGPGCTERFIHTVDLWFISAAKEVDNRAKGHINDVKSYLKLRRGVSGCKPLFTLIEFVNGIDLPDEVVSHPVIMALEEAVNDFVSWSNDIFSYNIEQSHHGTRNLVAVLMIEQGLDLQGAVDYCGRLCKISLQHFEENLAILPSWGEEVDKQVAIYVRGLQNWISGSLHWSFESARYFGKDAHIVKRERTVKLLPKRPL
ncbi:isoprenoid synthase domain-containing protein [Suillus clintonianus]|uniref:isoprenoid synthase domain-containing protein n=1 Tax=Suillus clintonianus TaxID=1904413 RepID=UPI001B87EAAD|nr:isoprenoid synthase domain-containing protein [Suillus clintonianus]KAG2141867.1 isoprenoid synthase domain-containing protein [Suillus clintonianus]